MHGIGQGHILREQVVRKHHGNRGFCFSYSHTCACHPDPEDLQRYRMFRVIKGNAVTEAKAYIFWPADH